MKIGTSFDLIEFNLVYWMISGSVEVCSFIFSSFILFEDYIKKIERCLRVGGVDESKKEKIGRILRGSFG